MKTLKRTLFIAFVIVFILAIIFKVYNFIDIRKQKYIWQNERYMKILYIEGECDYKITSVYVKNKEYTNMNQLYVDVAFYNYLKGDKISVEELLQEYDNFCNNEGSWDNLELFEEFDYADGIHGGEYYDYVHSVRRYIYKEKGISLFNADLEQVQEAVYVVNYLIDEYKIMYDDASVKQLQEAYIYAQQKLYEKVGK